MDSTKKISFGFSKLSKKPNIILNKVNEKKPENDIQMIQCLEGNSIKLLNEDTNKTETALVIPLQENRTSSALTSLKIRQAILTGEPIEEEKSEKLQSEDSNKINSLDETAILNTNESLEEKAAKELLEEIRNKTNAEKTDASFKVPLKPDELPLDGAEEAKIEDYEKIPISQFGLAMLRGMGWKDEENKKEGGKFDSDQPVLRPKGMGLGADKVIKAKPLLVAPEQNEKLEIKKNAYVRILGGKHKDLYGQIEGLDDHAGRVVVKLALSGNRESMNEFLVQSVSKAEYIKYGKVINSAKYEEYKRKQENEQQQDKQISIKYENIKEEKDIKFKKEIKEEYCTIKKEIKEEHKKEIKNEKHDKYYQESSSNSRMYESSHSHKNDHHNHHYRDSNTNRSREREKSPLTRRRHDKRYDNSEESSESSDDSSPDYHRRSKKKSSKSKKQKSKDRNRRYDSEDSAEDDKRHKKKTKKSKKARSRSRGRR